jgi:predicted peptidase
MKLKIILACLIAIQIASCQTNDETEISNNNDDINSTEIVQLVTVSDNLDLANLPTNSNYIKEQSLKGENASPYGYILRRPKEFGQDGLKYPILIYLHGSGSKGNSATQKTLTK